METEQQQKIVEALILASPEPLSAARIADIVPGLKPAGVRKVVEALNRAYESQDRAFEIWEVAGGYQLRTRSDYASWVKQLHRDRPARLSRAALETLAVIAYKQPVTRAEIEHVRGVDVGAVLRSLVERKLVRIAGHREVPGRPMLYGTSRRFLEVFGLKELGDLPTLREIDELVLPEGLEPPAGAEGAAPKAEGDEAQDGLPTPSAEAADAAPERRELH